jgi:type IV secretion system protein TrbL
MRMPGLSKRLAMPLMLWLAIYSDIVRADIDSAGVLDNVLDRYSNVASTWVGVITTHATWLFWTLALISMVWTFGMMALRKADLGEFFTEFIRFTIFTGFFWWLLINGANFATSIMNSLRQVGASAAITESTFTPSGIVDIGFDIFFKVLDQSTVWSPIDSAAGLVMSAGILVILALVGVNMLNLLVSGWILAYAGVFFLGFGGARWTSEMAISYFKTVLSIAAQLFAMVLLVGIAKSFVDEYYTRMAAGISLKELAVMAIVAVVLLGLVTKVPPMIGQIPMGGGTLALGGGLGAGAVIATAAMAGAAVATAGAAIAAGAAGMAGGAQALMAAYSKASASESAGGTGGSLMSAASGVGVVGDSGSGGTNTDGSLASAMGEADAVGGGSNRFFGATDANQAAGGSTDRGASTLAGRGGTSGSTTNGGKSGIATEAGSAARTDGASPASHASTDSKAAMDHGRSLGEVPPSSALATAGTIAAKIGRMAGGTAASLAHGSWDVARAKVSDVTSAAMNRIGETTGGKIAAAIKARDEASRSGTGASSFFDRDSLSSGTSEPADVDAEVAAFRDRS